MISLPFIRKKINPIINIDNLRVVISFSLYGKADLYIDGLVKNCEIIENIYPSFWKYIFIGNDFDKHILDKLNGYRNVRIIETGLSGHVNMSMRFTAIDYPEVGVAFSRDCDSFTNRRDIYCINGFLNSNKRFQIIRDHPESHKIEILGGMWAIKKGLLNFKLSDAISKFYNHISPAHGTDQLFLKTIIYPVIKTDLLVYDDFAHFPEESPHKINTSVPWNSYTHVGACVSYEEAIR